MSNGAILDDLGEFFKVKPGDDMLPLVRNYTPWDFDFGEGLYCPRCFLLLLEFVSFDVFGCTSKQVSGSKKYYM